jgi:serine/threonine-protein kinase HipA
VLFATERYDRTFEGAEDLVDGMLCPLRLHQEDFGQALGIPASGKYERPGEQHMKKMFYLLRRYSASPIEDQIRLWEIIVFHWLIGNTDGHIKNFSLVYDANLKAVRLAPAYDIVSTILYDTHSSEMAFSVGGQIEWNKIDRSCFEEACRECGLNKKLFMPLLDEKRALFRDALMRAAEVVHDEGFEDAARMAKRILEVSNVTS